MMAIAAHGREDQQNARRGAPTREVKGRRTDTVPERAKHRVDERAPRPNACRSADG
jgi:hypothetical protein